MAIVTMLDQLRPDSHGWIWHIHWKDGRDTTYRTSHKGDGLWLITKREEHQLLGTCQFELPQDRDEALRLIEQRFHD